MHSDTYLARYQQSSLENRSVGRVRELYQLVLMKLFFQPLYPCREPITRPARKPRFDLRSSHVNKKTNGVHQHERCKAQDESPCAQVCWPSHPSLLPSHRGRLQGVEALGRQEVRVRVRVCYRARPDWQATKNEGLPHWKTGGPANCAGASARSTRTPRS